jgi:hypothetical protein
MDNNASNSHDMDTQPMPLPPEGVYDTEDELFQSIQAWASSHSYCFRISRTKKESETKKKIFYVCDRYGKLPPIDRAIPRQRMTASRKTNCQFSVIAIQIKEYWEVRHRQGD